MLFCFFRVSRREIESCQDGEAVVQDFWQQGDEDSHVGAGRCRQNQYPSTSSLICKRWLLIIIITVFTLVKSEL